MSRKSSFKIPGVTFSMNRALGITTAKRKIARLTGIPTTREGRRRKFGPMGLWAVENAISQGSSDTSSGQSQTGLSTALWIIGILIAIPVLAMTALIGGLIVLVVIGSLMTEEAAAQNEPFGSGYAPNSTPARRQVEKRLQPAKAAKNLAFDPKVKARLWLQEKQGPHSDFLVSERGNEVQDKIVQYGKPISLEGCYFRGTIWYDVSDALRQAKESEIDLREAAGNGAEIKRNGNDARAAWRNVPVPGVALRVVFERRENGERYRTGPSGDATPRKDWTILMDEKGHVFAAGDSQQFAICDVREDVHELDFTGRGPGYDYRAPLK